MQDLFDALRTGHALADLCAEKAGMDWKARAFDAFVTHAKTHREFTTEDVRVAHPDVLPHDGRAWGSIARQASAAGIIRAAGQRRVRSSHGMFKTLWASCLFNGA